MSFITSPGIIVPPLTAGGVAYGTGSQAKVNSAGTVGQVLTSAGAGVPTWATATPPASAALVFISSQTVTTAVASVDFSNLLTSTYDDYVVYFGNVTVSSNTAVFQLRIQKSGSFRTTGYNFTYMHITVGAGTVVRTDLNQSVIEIKPNGYGVNVLGGALTFVNANGNQPMVVVDYYQTGAAATAGEFARALVGGTQTTAAVSTGLQFLVSNGTISAGTFRLYGLAKS